MDIDHHDASPPDHTAAPSSPPLPTPAGNGFLSPTRSSRRKERRDPSVTPRRFGRFFTPRTSQPIVGRRILASIDAEELNRQPLSPQSLASDGLGHYSPLAPSSPIQPLSSPSRNGRKRSNPGQTEPIIQRRGLVPDDMQPPHLDLPGRDASLNSQSRAVQDPSIDLGNATLLRFLKTSRGQTPSAKDRLLKDASRGPASKRQRSQAPDIHTPIPVRKFANRGFEAQFLDREQGYSYHSGREYLACPASDARAQTAAFYSNSSDHEYTTNYAEGGGHTIPFCQASYNNAPVTAVGDEQGYIRLFRTDGWVDGQSKVESFFKAHDNAIIDVDVSADDMRLATACGDWSGKVFDTTTQTAAVELKGHMSGMRQVLFQPGRANGNVLATAAKDGCINIWDLRCGSLPVNTFSTHFGDMQRVTRRNTDLDLFDTKPINSMDMAHVRTVNGLNSPGSITALQWFPSGREHLLVSGSECSAAIKLWDIRCIKPRHRDQATPLAVTDVPRHHNFRPYGLTSLALSSDATRLYSVCKDNTIYAYSTAHLILGQAPELVNSSVKRRPRAHLGIGPLYGWKNERLSGISFWVKSAIRPARGLQPELLAVGGNDKSPILFPTDERYMRTAFRQRSHILESSTSTFTPSGSRSTPSSLTPSADIPIFRCGTPLVGGHDKEVSTVSWTNTGRLVSLSDDGSMRHWQEDDRSRARYLRQVGDFGGERWSAGWAEVGQDWDAADDEDEEC